MYDETFLAYKGKMTALVSGVEKKNKAVTAHITPYTVEVVIVGTENILFHRYDPEAVEAKSGAKKGSAEKKTDNIESYVARGEDNDIVMPRENFKAAICAAAKSTQDPRSPRKSAKDLYKMGVKIVADASFGKKTWDFLDKRGVSVNMSRVTRTRPGILRGGSSRFRLL
jgi:hypothetical protein